VVAKVKAEEEASEAIEKRSLSKESIEKERM